MLTESESYFLSRMAQQLAPDHGLQHISTTFADRLRAELPEISDVVIAKVLTSVTQIGMHLHDGLQESDAYRDCPLHGLLRIMSCSAVQLTELERGLITKQED